VTDAKRKGRGERLGRRERRVGPVWAVGARERGTRKVDGLASFGLRREKIKRGGGPTGPKEKSGEGFRVFLFKTLFKFIFKLSNFTQTRNHAFKS
jgi:hypothetical protein